MNLNKEKNTSEETETETVKVVAAEKRIPKNMKEVFESEDSEQWLEVIKKEKENFVKYDTFRGIYKEKLLNHKRSKVKQL